MNFRLPFDTERCRNEGLSELDKFSTVIAVEVWKEETFPRQPNERDVEFNSVMTSNGPKSIRD